MKVAIIGYGHVGRAMHERFQDAVIYDEPLGMGDRLEVNGCFAAFVCVPTPEGNDGRCDTSIVESVLDWLETEVIILRSTVPVGFTDAMVEGLGKSIVFQPEYYGETPDHPFADLRNQRWLSFGGRQEAIDKAVQAYQTVVSSNIRINMASARDVEFAKYMENSFLATKVTFCNEMYDLAEKLGVDYNMAREVWVSDPRIGSSHTFVYPSNRGFGGHCLPKDTNALLYMGEEAHADMSLLESVIRRNARFKDEDEGDLVTSSDSEGRTQGAH